MKDINDARKKDAGNSESTLNSVMEVQANGNSNEEYDEFVKLLQNTFDQNLFPSDFDEWTVSEKYSWINKNLSKFYPNVPESLLEFIPASFHQGDCGRSPVEKPEWLDMDKYRRGQKFVQDYFIGITMTIVLSLLPTYTFENTLNPILLSNRTHTPFLGFKRYVLSLFLIR